MRYRSEIDGLRALAVIPVILFHAGFQSFSGGFVGVDVFFVISGYLITIILFDELKAETFSIAHFYERRARRILPALFFVMFVSMPFAWFWLVPEEMNSFSKALTFIPIFASNISFMRENNYFASASDLNPLIHTWSLAVEEQFYVVYPLLFLAWRPDRPWIVGLLVSIAAISLAAAQWASFNQPIFAFYMLPTRAWELLIGILVAFYYNGQDIKHHRHWLAQWASLLGLALVMSAVFTYSERTPFPGLYALVPTTGAALIIVFTTGETWVGRLLGSKPFVYIGLISYSAYLWHQPIFAFVRQRSLEQPSPMLMAGLTVAVVPLSYLSWRFVERPFRKRHRFTSRQIVTLALTCSLFFIVIGLIGTDTGGFAARVPKNRIYASESHFAKISNGWCFYSVDTLPRLQIGSGNLNCYVGAQHADLKGLLFGDSFAGQYEPFWDAIGKKSGLYIRSVTTNWCYPSISDGFTGPLVSRAYQQCLFNRQFLKNSLSKYDFVVFSGMWSEVLDANKLEDVLKTISWASRRSQLVIIMPAPKQFDANIYEKYVLSLMVGDILHNGEISYSRDDDAAKANAILKEASSKYPNVIYIERNALFNSNGLPSDLTAEKKPFSYDGKHISVYGSQQAAIRFLSSPAYASLQKKLTEIKASKNSQ